MLLQNRIPAPSLDIYECSPYEADRNTEEGKGERKKRQRYEGTPVMQNHQKVFVL